MASVIPFLLYGTRKNRTFAAAFQIHKWEGFEL